MSCWGIALSLYHVAADLHAQRVILDHSLGKSPLPLMIKSMTWQYNLYKKTTPNTESDDKGSILPILRAWHIPSGCKEISCSICCWMPWLTIWVFASESGLSRKSRLWGHWRQFLNSRLCDPRMGSSSVIITDLQHATVTYTTTATNSLGVVSLLHFENPIWERFSIFSIRNTLVFVWLGYLWIWDRFQAIGIPTMRWGMRLPNS